MHLKVHDHIRTVNIHGISALPYLEVNLSFGLNHQLADFWGEKKV